MTNLPTPLSPSESRFRREIREFLAETLPEGSYRPALGMSGARSREFSKSLAAKGWVGTSIPDSYGGHLRTAVERFILAEELFSAGAPVSGHWVGERQTAPMLLAFGTEEQKRRFLPAIARGDAWFSIGMSEPDAGSDLAAVRSRAERTDGGWSLSGTKIWTSGAAENDFFVVLCRTSPLGEDRHAGISQLIVDLRSTGIEISPIVTLDGAAHFFEVSMRDVFVPDDMVLGAVGEGWRQVNSELGFERSGPERFLSAYQVFKSFVARVGGDADTEIRCAVGNIASMFSVIRQMSLSLARSIDEGHPPGVEAAIVKDIGTTFEQSVVQTIQSLVEVSPDPGSPDRFESLLAESILMSPAWTIRGGTTEVLRTVASRALKKRSSTPAVDDPLSDAVAHLLTANGAPPVTGSSSDLDDRCWSALLDAGYPWVGVPESSGGEGGTVADACCVVRQAARFGVSTAVAETGLLAGWLLSAAGMPVERRSATVATLGEGRLVRAGDELTLSLSLHGVPWADRVEELVILVEDSSGRYVARVDLARLEITEGHNLAGEPRCGVSADRVRVSADDVAPAPEGLGRRSVELRGALARTVAMAGAAEAVSEMTIAYAGERKQFGRTIDQFQAVQHHLVRMASYSAVLTMAAALAAASYDAGDEEFMVAAAKIVAANAAGTVAGAAHQVHGAIGMTREHPLHRYTRSLWSWRQEFGSSRYWSEILGSQLLEAGADELWSRITASGAVSP